MICVDAIKLALKYIPNSFENIIFHWSTVIDSNVSLLIPENCSERVIHSLPFHAFHVACSSNETATINSPSQSTVTFSIPFIDEWDKSILFDIIDFENSILNGIKHLREEYRHMIDSGNKYIRITKNSEYITVPEEDVLKIKECVEFIESHYEKHRKDQSETFF